MEERHNSANHILCVVSEAYLKAPYSSWERRAAQWAATTTRPNFLIPVFIEPCEPPTLFAPLKRCDLHGLAEPEARLALSDFLKPASRPSQRAPFPSEPGAEPARHHAFPGGENAEPDSQPNSAGHAPLPRPPFLAALPRYLGSHDFVGRESELQTLSDWCAAADPNPMLLLEAIGGSGKSMLTWEWTTKHAQIARSDWAGLFWYSFYEKGAVMADFCCQALGYMTQRPVEQIRRLGPEALVEYLLRTLQQRPWLLVLDGLERVLVAYHRHDAAQLIDSVAGLEVDHIASRDPCAAIRIEDGELLRQLAAASPSKILVSSRLTPRVLINSSQMAVPGVRREILRGLRPADAEALIRRCGVKGNSEEIRAFLQHNCDCHPLVVGALAGLINDYPYDRGNFDRWVRDQNGGMALKLSELDLVKRQNHILLAAMAALDTKSRQLLHLLSILQGAVDFRTIEALVHASGGGAILAGQSDNSTIVEGGVDRRDVASILRNLEKRGLVQYDSLEKRYDLHPVVRGVAVARIDERETHQLGLSVVDHFTRKQHDPWEHAETLEAVADGIQVVSTYLRMRRYSEAFYALQGELANALYFNLGAFAELLSLAEGFFADGWDCDPKLNESEERWYILNLAAASISPISEERSRELFERAISLSIQKRMINCLYVSIVGFSGTFDVETGAADIERLRSLAMNLAKASQDPELVFMSKLKEYTSLVIRSDWQLADDLWTEIESLGRDWTSGNYRPGDAEGERARDLFYRGKLTEEAISKAEEISKRGGNRRMVRALHEIRGGWYLERKEPGQAIEHFSRALAMYRQNGLRSSYCEARLILAKILAGEEFDGRSQADEIVVNTVRAAVAMAELWQVLGEKKKAIENAEAAYRSALKWGAVTARYYADAALETLKNLGVPVPIVAAESDPREQIRQWESDVSLLVDGLRSERRFND